MSAELITTGALCALLGGTLSGAEDVPIRGAAALSQAGAADVALAGTDAGFSSCNAGLVLAEPGLTLIDGALAQLALKDPERAFDWCRRYLRARAEVQAMGGAAGVSVSPEARLGDWVLLFPGVHIAAGAVVGSGTVIRAHAVVESGVVLGARCEVGAGAVIGSESESFAPGLSGFRRVPGTGSVVVREDACIGPLTVIEKGTSEHTVIGARSMLGGQVYVAHDCQIGAGCLVQGQSGLASEVVLEDSVTLMGRVAVNSAVRIGRGAVVFGGSGVFGDVAARAQVVGYPARPRHQALKAMALSGRVEALRRRLSLVEQQLSEQQLFRSPH